ncbi:MAG: hypothetical protein WBN70_06860 [Polyangiales bacterium]
MTRSPLFLSKPQVSPGLSITTLEMDKLKQSLPTHYAPSTVNHHFALVLAVLRYALKRNLLQSIPYIPTEKVI